MQKQSNSARNTGSSISFQSSLIFHQYEIPSKGVRNPKFTKKEPSIYVNLIEDSISNEEIIVDDDNQFAVSPSHSSLERRGDGNTNYENQPSISSSGHRKRIYATPRKEDQRHSKHGHILKSPTFLTNSVETPREEWIKSLAIHFCRSQDYMFKVHCLHDKHCIPELFLKEMLATSVNLLNPSVRREQVSVNIKQSVLENISPIFKSQCKREIERFCCRIGRDIMKQCQDIELFSVKQIEQIVKEKTQNVSDMKMEKFRRVPEKYVRLICDWSKNSMKQTEGTKSTEIIILSVCDILCLLALFSTKSWLGIGRNHSLSKELVSSLKTSIINEKYDFFSLYDMYQNVKTLKTKQYPQNQAIEEKQRYNPLSDAIFSKMINILPVMYNDIIATKCEDKNSGIGIDFRWGLLEKDFIIKILSDDSIDIQEDLIMNLSLQWCLRRVDDRTTVSENYDKNPILEVLKCIRPNFLSNPLLFSNCNPYIRLLSLTDEQLCTLRSRSQRKRALQMTVAHRSDGTSMYNVRPKKKKTIGEEWRNYASKFHTNENLSKPMSIQVKKPIFPVSCHPTEQFEYDWISSGYAGMTYPLGSFGEMEGDQQNHSCTSGDNQGSNQVFPESQRNQESSNQGKKDTKRKKYKGSEKHEARNRKRARSAEDDFKWESDSHMTLHPEDSFSGVPFPEIGGSLPMTSYVGQDYISRSYPSYSNISDLQICEAGAVIQDQSFLNEIDTLSPFATLTEDPISSAEIKDSYSSDSRVEHITHNEDYLLDDINGITFPSALSEDLSAIENISFQILSSTLPEDIEKSPQSLSTLDSAPHEDKQETNTEQLFPDNSQYLGGSMVPLFESEKSSDEREMDYVVMNWTEYLEDF